jgi:hypothetical protein
VVHDSHDGVLIPPIWVLDAFYLSSHDNDLAGRDELATSVCGTKVLRNTGWCNFAVQGLCQSVDHLGSLSRSESRWRAGCENKVAIKINDESITWCCEECAALSSHTEDIWSWLLDKLFDVTSMHNWNVKTTPLVNPDAESDRLCSNGQDSWVMTGEDNAAGWGDSSLNHTNNVWNGQTHEKGPHGKVLEARGRRRKLVA